MLGPSTYIFNQSNEDASIMRTVLSGPKVSGIEDSTETSIPESSKQAPHSILP